MGDIRDRQQCTMEHLRDVGFSESLIEQYLLLVEQGKTAEQVRMLRKHRAALLDEAHSANQRIDRLDILLYNMRKEARP